MLNLNSSKAVTTLSTKQTMRTSLMRTGSVPVLNPVHSGSTRTSLSRQASFTGDNHRVQSPKVSLHFHSTDKHSDGINRSLSESLMINSPIRNLTFSQNLNRIGSQYFPIEDTGFGSGGGFDHGDVTVTTGGNGGERMKIGAYYEEMLKSNPTDALLLRNYGKYLHEVSQIVTQLTQFIFQK